MKIKIRKTVLLRNLLNMEYTTAELAAALEINTAQLTNAIRFRGLPARKTSNGKYWIVGTDFVKWYDLKPRESKHYARNEFYCFTCKDKRTGQDVIEKFKTIPMLYAVCPVCGRIVHKFAKRTHHD